jgi:hypothetical protein
VTNAMLVMSSRLPALWTHVTVRLAMHMARWAFMSCSVASTLSLRIPSRVCVQHVANASGVAQHSFGHVSHGMPRADDIYSASSDGIVCIVPGRDSCARDRRPRELHFSNGAGAHRQHGAHTTQPVASLCVSSGCGICPVCRCVWHAIAQNGTRRVIVFANMPLLGMSCEVVFCSCV